MFHFGGTLVLLKREQPDFEAAARTLLATFDGGLDRLASEQLKRGLSPPSVADAAPRVQKKRKGVRAQGASNSASLTHTHTQGASNSASASAIATCQWDEPASSEEDLDAEDDYVEKVWGDKELRQEEAAYRDRIRLKQQKSLQ